MQKYKKCKISLIIISIIIALASLWFIFDINSELELLFHKEKYSFKLNFASFLMQNDYYFGKNYPDTDSFYKNLKAAEEKYSNLTDDISIKINELNNLAFDRYHDLISLEAKEEMFLTLEDILFLAKNNESLADDILDIALLNPTLEDYSTLKNELKIRKEAIKVIRQDLKQRKINAKILLNDIRYENLMPAFLDENEAPKHVQEFTKIMRDLADKNSNNFNDTLNKECKQKSSLEETTKCYVEIKLNSSKSYYDDISKINETWKHRYNVLAVENKKDGNKIYHLYEVYPYKEGNRIYWSIEYHSPTSEFLKAYLKMLELLMDI